MRVAPAALSMLLVVVLAALASGLLLREGHVRTLSQQVARGAAATATLYQREADATRLLMHQVCNRDTGVARRASEGPQPTFTADDLQSLRRVLGADVWIVIKRGGPPTRVAASADFATAPPSDAALRAASGAPRTYVGSAPLVIRSCSRALSGGQLWIVRVEPLSSLITRLSPSPPLRVISEADAAHRGDDEHADARALRIEGADGAPSFSLWLRASEAPPIDALLAYVPLLILLLVFGALLTHFAVVRRSIEEGVLLELERAATRVASGDLSARINRRPGGRADQTFQTFDRMTAELQEMRTKLADAERVAAWQDMARRIAHEIKNPLSPIQLAIETLRKAHARQLPEFDEIFEESTRAILEEVRRMEHIVREFSEFARLPRARPGALELSALVRETLSLYEPEDVAVTFLHDGAPVEARADREQLTQVIVNLLQNAVDAARTSTTPRVSLELERGKSGVLLHVDDSGPGIAPDDRERVFEPYYTTKAHGTGLGLAIVRRIAFDHEGSIQASASPLGGARFTLRLP